MFITLDGTSWVTIVVWKGFEPLFSTNYLSPVYQTGGIPHNVFYFHPTAPKYSFLRHPIWESETLVSMTVK